MTPAEGGHGHIEVSRSDCTETKKAAGGSVRMELHTNFFAPDCVIVPGGEVTIELVSASPALHTFTVDDQGIDGKGPGRRLR